MAKSDKQLYMVLDVTKNEDLKVRFVGDIHTATLLGQIYMLEHPDRKVIAPPILGRSLSKFDMIQLQYLYWNMTQKTPAAEYNKVLQDCMTIIEKIEPDPVSVESLQSQKELLEAAAGRAAGNVSTSGRSNKPPREQKAPKEPKDPNGTPRRGSTCGLIWEICDTVYTELGSPDLANKTLRNNVFARCIEKEGINKSTVNVQFGKWKASKNPAAS